jgi:hypothetical protein
VLEAFQYPRHEVGEDVVPTVRDRGRDELGLAARAVRGHYQAARERVGRRRSVVGPYEM